MLSSAGVSSLLTERVGRWEVLLRKAAYDPRETQLLCTMLTEGARAGVLPTLQGRLVVRRSVANSQSAYSHEAVVDAYLEREVVDLGRVLRLGQTLPEQWKEPYVSPVAVIPKPRSEKFRLIHNLSSGGRHSVNERIPVELGYVQYITHRDIAVKLLSLGQGVWLFSFDVEDAFRHIPVHPDDWQYFLILWKGTLYADKRVGFGSCTGPAHYDRLGRALVAIMAHQGVDLMRMVDDHLGSGATQGQCGERQTRAHALLAFLGLPRAVHKDVDPTHVVDFTGIRWDTAEMLASIPEAKWCFMVAEVQGVVDAGRASLDQLRSVVGRLMNVVTIVPRGKAHLQACYALIAEATESAGVGGGPRGRSASSRERALTPVVLGELAWWRRSLGSAYARSPRRPVAHIVSGQTCELDPALPPVTCPCDASGKALGAVWGQSWAVHLVPAGLGVGLLGEVGSTYVELCVLREETLEAMFNQVVKYLFYMG